MMTSGDVRARLTHALRLDLIGPEPEEPQVNEVLPALGLRPPSGAPTPPSATAPGSDRRPAAHVLIAQQTVAAEQDQVVGCPGAVVRASHHVDIDGVPVGLEGRVAAGPVSSPRHDRASLTLTRVSEGRLLAYERGSVDLLERMAGTFDRQGARLHGLTHLKRDKSQPCECMACAGRRGQLALPDLSS